MVLVLAKCGKISNVQASGSVVTVVLKKAVPAIRKSYDSYHEKANPAVRKSCDSYHEKAVPAVRKSCLLCAETNEVRWVISNCWEGHFSIYFMDFAENDKIFLKGILLFLV